jgi:signal transduction histidine kinase
MSAPPTPRPEEIIRGLAHDVVNPLSSVSGFVKLLLDPDGKEPPTHRQTRMLVAMDRACTHIVGLLKDISDLSGLESGAAPERAPADLRAAARRTLEEHEVLARHKRIHMSLEAPEDLPAVNGDRRLLECFFDALLRTAGRLTREGGRILIRLGPSADGKSIEGILDHDGDGLAADAWERLFAASLAARPPEGYGALSAALCRRIAVAHGGDLTAEPGPAGGTLFRFRFPRP